MKRSERAAKISDQGLGSTPGNATGRATHSDICSVVTRVSGVFKPSRGIGGRKRRASELMKVVVAFAGGVLFISALPGGPADLCPLEPRGMKMGLRTAWCDRGPWYGIATPSARPA